MLVWFVVCLQIIHTKTIRTYVRVLAKLTGGKVVNAFQQRIVVWVWSCERGFFVVVGNVNHGVGSNVHRTQHANSDHRHHRQQLWHRWKHWHHTRSNDGYDVSAIYQSTKHTHEHFASAARESTKTTTEDQRKLENFN